jgi:hypothetical protein
MAEGFQESWRLVQVIKNLNDIFDLSSTPVAFHQNGTKRFELNNFGVSACAPTAPGHMGAQTIAFNLEDSAFAPLGRVGWNGSDTQMDWVNLSHGANSRIQTENNSGTRITHVEFDPDADTANFTTGLQLNGLQMQAVVTETTTNLIDNAHAINTSALKVAGYMVFNTTTSIPVWAAGSGDSDVWVDATGATAHTPV